MDWEYFNLVDGRIVDEIGVDVNINWPSFESFEEAEEFLEDNDIRANIR